MNPKFLFVTSYGNQNFWTIDQPLPECRWINTFPNDFSGAIELARRLLIDEAMSERRALPEMLLHWA